MNFSVIGCGRWGAFIAWYLNRQDHNVTLYGRKGSKKLEQLRAFGKNEYMHLSNVKLSDDLNDIADSEVIFISINSQNLRELMKQLKDAKFSKKNYVLCMKGIEQKTGKLLTLIVSEYTQDSKTAIWVGPGHVQEFNKGVPNCMVIDSKDEKLKNMLIRQLSSELIRFYYGTDLIGNQIGAASKNVIGIAAGMLDGLYFTSLKGALMSRGTYEISKLIVAMGGEKMTAYGLAHLGDYEATVFSQHSHNRKYGEMYVKKQKYDYLAEGVYTVDSLMMLSKKYQVELPICQAVYDVIYNKKDPKSTISGLFLRSLKKEF